MYHATRFRGAANSEHLPRLPLRRSMCTSLSKVLMIIGLGPVDNIS